MRVHDGQASLLQPQVCETVQLHFHSSFLLKHKFNCSLHHMHSTVQVFPSCYESFWITVRAAHHLFVRCTFKASTIQAEGNIKQSNSCFSLQFYDVTQKVLGNVAGVRECERRRNRLYL